MFVICTQPVVRLSGAGCKVCILHLEMDYFL